MEFTRRQLSKGSTAVVLSDAMSRVAAAEPDPPASWRDGQAKKAILDFIRATTDHASPKFVPEAERIATFDQDGTLWVEHPMYSQIAYYLTGRQPW